MNSGGLSPKLSLLFLGIMLQFNFNSVYAAVCEYSIIDGNKLYNYKLASPIPSFPHGVLSEDGFYKVAANDTILWFQLCNGMIFNHDPPRCVDCLDCGGSTRCGMGCNAIVANNIGGYYVCDTIALNSSINISVIDERNPHMGVIMKLSSIRARGNCSLSVSVVCDLNGVQGPESLQKLEACNYATVLRHPAGCAIVVSVHGKAWGWFGVLLTILLCLLGAYLLAGIVYRSFFLGIRGLEVVPNLDFWTNLPHRAQWSVLLLDSNILQPSNWFIVEAFIALLAGYTHISWRTSSFSIYQRGKHSAYHVEWLKVYQNMLLFGFILLLYSDAKD